MTKKSLADVIALCKRQGFIYQASEIYGGINGFWDYGPLGVLLKNNLRDAWWRDTVLCPPVGPDGDVISMVGLDSSIIQNPKTWVASGHVDGFSDPMVDCRETKARYRADHVKVYVPKDGAGVSFAFLEGQAEEAEKKIAKAKRSVAEYQLAALTELPEEAYAQIVAPDTTKAGTLTQPRAFNLMFQTYIGATATKDDVAYLRPETAQGIFINFKNVLSSSRVKVPFGIAQVGKAFRNEVTPRHFIFRSREFEQMEIEWFCAPEDAQKWFEFWVDYRQKWWKKWGISADHLQARAHDKDELVHYAKEGRGVVDLEYRFPFTDPGFGELEGIAHRSDFDLRQHQIVSKQRMDYFDQENNRSFIPHVIEPSAGLSRGVLAILSEAYTVDESRPSGMYMNFHPQLAPVKAGIFPLVNKDGLPEIAEKLYHELRTEHVVQMDAKQSIGKRYARMDECGTPFCLTIDGQTHEDHAVTVRHRNTQAQERVALDRVSDYLKKQVAKSDK